jgi:hypothetical protein
MEKVIMKKALWMRLVFGLVTALPIAACTAQSSTKDTTGEYVDDASITTKVKAALLDDTGLKSFDISVTTDKDIVHLNGRVNTYEVKSRATQIASGIPGVRAVVNNIVVNQAASVVNQVRTSCGPAGRITEQTRAGEGATRGRGPANDATAVVA